MASQSFDARAVPAITDRNLKQALGRATLRFRTERERAMNEVDGQDLRDRAQAIRDRTLEHLGEHLSHFADAAEAAGMRVHWALDAAEAKRIILEIAAAHKVNRVVKSKSMVTEEIGLNHALEQAGITVTETDLGEWIVQLAGQTPSHILAPAVHFTRQQVADLFARHAGEKIAADIPSLVSYARGELRYKFIDADVGISGVNFAVAETGTLAILTNEGNGRLVTGLPRVHVAVMSMEKIVPTWDDLTTLITVLTRSATGQPITSYLNLIAGPRQPGESDGPEEIHVVVLDNGRSALLGSVYQQALRCIRCSACLNVCPVYRQVGGHTYRSTYSGPIGSILSPLLQGLVAYHELPHASSLCLACRDVCPVRIDLPGLLLQLRQDEAEGKPPVAGRVERLAFHLFGYLVMRPRLYRFATRLASYALRPFAHRGYLSKAPFPLSRWTRARDLHAIAARPFHAQWREIEHETHGRSNGNLS